MDRDELLRLLRALEAARLDYVVIGATAMGFHGVIRATEDIDLIVNATPENLARLRQALRAAYGDDPSIEEIRDQDLLGEYPSVRYYPPRGDLFVDVMTRLGEVASYGTVDAELVEIEGIRVRVATPRALHRLKRDTLRPLDRQDAWRWQRDSGSTKWTEMPVERFRSIEEMNAAPVRRRDGGDSFERFIRHCARYRLIFPRRYPRGVFKFRSQAEAQAAREQVAASAARRPPVP